MEDECPADSALVPGVSSAAVSFHVAVCMLLFCRACCSHPSHTRFLPLCPCLSPELCPPSIVFADFFLMNLILWVEGSSAAIPFGTLVAILALWFGISVPLTFVGAYFGFKKAVSRASHNSFVHVDIIDRVHSSFLFAFCTRQLSNRCEQIRSPVKFLSSLSSQSPSPVL